MEPLTILSPHRDDSIFSLGVALSVWARRPELHISVINFFTISQYAPRTGLIDRAAISTLRKAEDRLALRQAGPRMEMHSLDLLDAPLRVGVPWPDVCRPEVSSLLDEALIQQLTERLRAVFSNGMLLAPLGLGDHLDHLTVRQAAVRACKRKRLAFYEDLPYAIWTSDERIQQKRQAIEAQIGCVLRPAVIRARNGVWTKRRLASRYKSQIDGKEAATIAQFAARYRGGERIWVPKNSGCWLRLLRISH